MTAPKDTMVDVVCSVPHSGTRTLVKHLGIGGNSPRGEYLHFDYDDVKLRVGKHLHLHIPVRDPMDVAASWARRKKKIDGLIRAYDSMFNHLGMAHTLHKIEDIEPLEGTNDHKDRVTPAWRLAEYQGIVREQVVDQHRQFFDRFY
jgi:hypothetical protein